MPQRGKRNLTEFNPNASDPEDEDYDVSPSKTSHSRATKPQRSKPVRKKRRTGYDGGDSSDDEGISETDLSANDSLEDSAEEENVELGPTGRPKRRAAKNTRPIIDEESDEIEDDDDVQVLKPTSKKGRPERKSVVLRFSPEKLATLTDKRRRSDRKGSSSAQPSRPTSSGTEMTRTWQGSRKDFSKDDLTAMIQDAPETRIASKRPTHGGKGPQKGLSQVEPTDGEESSGIIKDQPSTDELQRDHYKIEIAESRENLATDPEPDTDSNHDTLIVEDEDNIEISETPPANTAIGDNEDEDDGPVTRGGRATRRRESKSATSEEAPLTRHSRNTVLGKRKTRSSQKSANQESSDFEPMNEEVEEEDVSDSERSASPRKNSQDDAEYSITGRRGPKRRRGNTRSRRVSDESDAVDEQDEIIEELEDLQAKTSRRKRPINIIMEPSDRTRRRRDHNVNYDIMASNAAIARAIEENEDDATVDKTPSKRPRATGNYGRSLFSTYGPFGGAGGAPPVLGGPIGLGAIGGADSDSSDDEIMQRPKRGGTGLGGTVGMTPTTGHPSAMGMLPSGPMFGAETAQGLSGTPANLGKLKDKQTLADADPLGVDQNVNFSSVGGLGGHINQLKEMVMLPLLYPELFLRYRVTPPRGVLFHGPPGTGKTLLARALASSVSSGGQKVTFYMRKGADALSKWVGEAERQLRLLFEEARKTQPSIIFFDEIDGLAPVRSSKQEQIHASIVSTLLALMDGMDGRGQVIVIGATNRPDSVDPALRRPGRFDREFYFPLPDQEARRAILDIHTKGWSPPLSSSFKDEIAKATKGYGGADLRALCTEAALNAIQRRYPQIYRSEQKLQLRPETIKVTARDFMISVKKMVPSSERSASSGAAPLPKHIEPLLRQPLEDLREMAAEVLPQKKILTALEEAEYEDAEDDEMAAERTQQEFDRSRIFRPRLLIRGPSGMGQQYLAAALLNYFESLHLQAFDLATLLSDSTRSSEAAIVQLFTEVKRHKPSVIFIPNVNTWYHTVSPAVISTLCGLLQSLPPTDPVLLLGLLETEIRVDQDMLSNLFGYSRRCQFVIRRPDADARRDFFDPIQAYIETPPDGFPSPTNRKKRVLEILLPVPVQVPKEPPPLPKAEIKAQKQKDRLLLNQLKIRIQPVMDHIKNKYRKFRLPIVDEKEIRYLFEEDDPEILTSDIPQGQQSQHFRPYEKAKDRKGVPVLRETETGRFFYNLDVATIEKRLSNGYYKRPKDFLKDVKRISKDAKMIGDEDRILKANELLANVEIDMAMIELEHPLFVAELENVYERELKREKDMIEKAKVRAAEEGQRLDAIASNVPPPNTIGSSTDASTGPIKLGQPLSNGLRMHPLTPSNQSSLSNGLSDLSNLDGHAPSNTTSIPSHDEAEIYMTTSDERPSTEKDSGSSFGPSAQTRGIESYTGPLRDLEHRKTIHNEFSQQDGITSMAPGSQPADYANDASTTSSDKRNTGSSADKGFASQSQSLSQSQSFRNGPDLSHFREQTEPNSQLPDTAPNTQTSQSSAGGPDSIHSEQSSPSQQLSQPDRSSQPPVSNVKTPKAALANILNQGPEPRPQKMEPTGLPPINIRKDYNDVAFQYFIQASSGCSVEQLEQLYSGMMSEVWKQRQEYDRQVVMEHVRARFEEELQDIQELQGMAPASQGED